MSSRNVCAAALLATIAVLLAAQEAGRGGGQRARLDPPACAPSLLSKDESQRLLSVIPAAESARRLGGRVDAVDWTRGAEFRNDVYYFYMLLTDRKQATLLDNGLIGYFAVNKRTGSVVEAASGATVQGKALAMRQAEIRTRHCVTREMLNKNDNIPLQKE
jgi:hypothetical protein